MFEEWDNFDFDGASDEFYNQMIVNGAHYGIGSNLSQTRTKQELRDRGFAFSNQKFSDIWNGIQSDKAGFNHFTSIGVNQYANDDVLPYAGWMNTRYGYVAEYSSVTELGDIIPGHTMAFYTDERLTPKEALARFNDIGYTYYGLTGEEIDTIELSGALFNGDYDIGE